MNLFCKGSIVGVLTLVSVAIPTLAQPADEQFALVNVINLFDLFSLDPNVIDPNVVDVTNPGSEPAGWQDFADDPRLGTNPSSIAIGGDRFFIGTFWNNQPLNWLGATGVAGGSGLFSASGFGLPFDKFLNASKIGPTIGATENISGLDFDATLNTLYIAYDDTDDFVEGPFAPSALPQQPSYIGALDVDPNSAMFGDFFWKLEDPFDPPEFPPFDSGDRMYGGINADPLDNRYVIVPQNGAEFVVIDNLDPAAALDPNTRTTFNVRDFTVCDSTFFRSAALDPVTGDLFARNANALILIPRRIDPDTSVPDVPYRSNPRAILEPFEDGDGIANTEVQAGTDDEQIIALGAAVGAGDVIIGPGPNGKVDTLPAGDDVADDEFTFTSRVIGSIASGIGDNCNDDPNNGFLFQPLAQGQNMAFISGTTLADPNDPNQATNIDLVVANNRPRAGSGMPTDIRFATRKGIQVAELQLPCQAPADSDAQTGIAFYDFDYDPTTGTLAVLEFETRRIFVYQTQLPGGPFVPRYDFSRNGAINIADLAGFQECFTGSEVGDATGGLSLNCMRVNTNADCDVDFDDYLVVEDYFEANFGR